MRASKLFLLSTWCFLLGAFYVLQASNFKVPMESEQAPGNLKFEDAGVSDDMDNARNILIIGMTGAGKASTANAILGGTVFRVGSAIQSTTRTSNDTATVGTHQVHGYKYKIAIVDTVGVADDRREDSSIQRKINNALENFTKLNLIVLVFKNERFTSQERGSFTRAITALESRIPEASSITALVVTYCEQKDDKARKEIISNLEKEGAPTANIVHFARKGTCLVGLPKLSDVAEAVKEFTKQKVQSDEQKLQKMAKDSITKEKIIPPQSDTNCYPTEWYCGII